MVSTTQCIFALRPKGPIDKGLYFAVHSSFKDRLVFKKMIQRNGIYPNIPDHMGDKMGYVRPEKNRQTWVLIVI